MEHRDAIKNALCCMAAAPNGGHATTAAMLGLSKTCFENRLYQLKGQALSIEQAMLLQRMTERTDFAEAVAHESGGVFVRLPDVDEKTVVGLDINQGFLDTFTQLGELVKKHSLLTDDGKITQWESALMWRDVTRLLQQLTGIAVITDRVYGVFYDAKQST